LKRGRTGFAEEKTVIKKLEKSAKTEKRPEKLVVSELGKGQAFLPEKVIKLNSVLTGKGEISLTSGEGESGEMEKKIAS